MFFFLGTVLFAAGCIPLVLTLLNREKMNDKRFGGRLRFSFILILVVIVAITLFNIFVSLYTDFLWFSAAEYGSRFLIEIGAKILLFGVSFLLAAVFLVLNAIALRSLSKSNFNWLFTSVVILAGSVLVASIMTGSWNSFLLFINSGGEGPADPVFNMPLSWYLFSLPFLTQMQALGMFTVIMTAIMLLVLYFIGDRSKWDVVKSTDGAMRIDAVRFKKGMAGLKRHLFFLGGILLFFFSFGSFLSLFELLYGSEGVVTGAGFVDVVVRRPALIVQAVLLSFAGVLLVLSSFSKRISGFVLPLKHDANGTVTGVGIKSFWLVFVVAVPVLLFNSVIAPLVEGFIVKPNEITREKPYLEHNIKFTRQAYGIDEKNISESVYNVNEGITQSVASSNRQTLDNIRLWDWRALMDNLREQQEIRLYYKFHDVDIDRYEINGNYQQVMLAVREMEIGDLVERSKTWVAEHLKYTHGYGVVLLPVNKFLAQGGPKMLIKNIPAENNTDNLGLTRPQIYYGERTNNYVYVKTSEQEFDYPLGNENKYTTYEGESGVHVGSFWHRLLFALKFDDYRLLFSTYFTDESRVLFRRNIIRRLKHIAPFLIYDNDPYAVLTDDGKLKYIADAYTVSARYPYSERYRGRLEYLQGLNYIRNSVKAVVDAYTGEVELYIADDSDIIVSTYEKIYPDLFAGTIDDMPKTIRKHIRYPVDYLLIQSEMYSIYHMTRPDVFYQREDVWQFATERYREFFQDVMPYYVMVEFPEQQKTEFMLVLPFTPKNKNVINAWMAGRSDGEQYGNITVFTFPKGIQVLGPRQIEARIDQDTAMSQAMTLWGQRGSEVIRGNLLTIPLFEDGQLYILYAEPVFLQAENAQLPEVKRIILADQEKVVWADTFEGALDLLLKGTKSDDSSYAAAAVTAQAGVLDTDRVREAVDLFDRLQNNLGQSNYSGAGQTLDSLRSVMDELKNSLEE